MPYKDPEMERASSKARSARWRDRHRQQYLGVKRAFYHRNRARLLDEMRRYRQERPESSRQKKRVADRAYRQRTLEFWREYNRFYYLANSERIRRAVRSYARAKRRDLLRRTAGGVL